MKTNLAILILLTAACAPRAIPVGIVATAPHKTAPVAPAVEKLRSGATAANTAGNKMEAGLSRISGTGLALSELTEAATRRANLLSVQGTATPRDLESNWLALVEIGKKTSLLQQDVKQAKAIAAEQKILRDAADRELVDLTRLAYARDAETETHRLQSGDKNATILTQAEAIAAQQKAAVKSAGDFGRFIKILLIVAFVAAILVAAAKFFLRP